MKQLLFAVALMLCTAILGQARIGYSMSEIKSEFSEFSQRTGYTDDMTPYLRVDMSRASVIYYFEDGICTLSVVVPDDQGALNYFVEQYNRQYVILSPSEWKAYVSGGIIGAKLFFKEEGGYYIIWYPVNE